MGVYSQFADLLDYPRRRPSRDSNGAAFLAAIEGKSLEEIQELYINAFDFRPDCTPNLGYHLFGDDGRRGLFLAELKERMQNSGIPLGAELPDHISLVLRYIDAAEDDRAAVIQDCLVPAVTRMAEALDSSGNPYRHALRALLAALET